MTSRRIAAALALSAVLLTGCASLIDKPERPVLYDMGPLPVAVADAQAAVGVAVVLPDIEAAGALDQSLVLYRLAYADDRQLRAYALARWTAPPAQLLRQRLRQQLGRERPVLSLDESAGLRRERDRPLLVLRTELEDFAQVFDAPDRSRGVLRLRATLSVGDGNGERLLAQRSIAVEAAAASPDAAGGVRALTAAADVAARELGTWLRQSAVTP